MTTLFDIAQNWLNQDPDAETHAELTALLTAAKNGDEKAQSELQDRKRDVCSSDLAVYNLVLRGFVDHYKQALWV